MPAYFLGVDVGSTKTHALVADQTGRALSIARAGSGNHEVVGYAGLRASLQDAAFQALESAGLTVKEVSGAGFGVSGYDWPSELPATQEAICSLDLRAPCGVVNDAILGLLAGASQGWGVAVVAGTGCNCRGLDEYGREGRVTGLGGLFGEFGGATDLVVRALNAVSYAWSLRGPPTSLTEAFIHATGAKDVVDLLEGLTLDRYRLDAAAAPLVFQVANQGDPVARQVIAWIGRELGYMAVAVIRQLELQARQFEVVQVGSLYEGGPQLLEPMRQVIQQEAPMVKLVRLAAPPVVGAALLGMEQVGMQPAAIRPRLVRSTLALLRGRHR